MLIFRNSQQSTKSTHFIDSKERRFKGLHTVQLKKFMQTIFVVNDYTKEKIVLTWFIPMGLWTLQKC